eukprot:447302_1
MSMGQTNAKQVNKQSNKSTTPHNDLHESKTDIKQNTLNRKKENGPFKFHNETEQNLVNFVKSTSKQNDGYSVMKSIDTFCWNNHWMMHIGPDKGKILDFAITNCKPKYILELGTYCGYSSIRMVTTNKNKNNINDTRLYSIEINQYNKWIAEQLINYSGYDNNIKIFNGNTRNIIPKLKGEICKYDKDFNGFDLIFIDHAKDLYLSDLQLIEKCDLIKQGSYVVADNVLVFGLNNYLSHVRNSGKYESKIYESYLEYDKSQKWKDGVEISIRNRNNENIKVVRKQKYAAL